MQVMQVISYPSSNLHIPIIYFNYPNPEIIHFYYFKLQTSRLGCPTSPYPQVPLTLQLSDNVEIEKKKKKKKNSDYF